MEGVSAGSEVRLVCGVSGGVDSMSLLYLMYLYGYNCTVVHCNYQLRGEESDKDMMLVEQMASMWGFDCITARFDPIEAEDENTQAWARDCRYRAFRGVAEDIGADYIVTAHHRDDQIETILQKIFRGAGLGAWKGMDPVEGDLLRPLLEVSKEEILDFASEAEIPFREDETNLTSKYARNLIRRDLTPGLDRLFPGWKENVLALSDRAAEFDAMAIRQLNEVEAGGKSLHRGRFLELPDNLKRVVLHAFLKRYAPDETPSRGDIEQADHIGQLQTGSALHFSTGNRLVRNREIFHLTDNEDVTTKEPALFEKKDLKNETFCGDITLMLLPWIDELPSGTLHLDSGKLKWPVTVRQWADGDRIQPLGMEGSKLVSDLLTDKKIDATQKKEAILIESFDGIVCAVIFPHVSDAGQIGIISERVKCTPGTKQILQIDKQL